jgi:adenylate cyclase
MSDPGMAAVAAALVAAAVLGLRAVGWMQRLELAHYDHLARLAAAGPPNDARIALVEVSEEDIQALGSWPLSDGTLARTIEILSEAGARTIGVDIYRDIPVAPGSAELDAVFARNQRVVFPSKFADASSPGVAPPAALAGTQQVGFNNIVVDPDGIVRRGLLFMDDGTGGVGYSFPLLLALLYLEDEGVYATPDPDDPALMRLGPITFQLLTDTAGSYAGIDAGGYQYLVDYRGAARAFPSIELRDLLDGSADLSRFDGRIVIVGLTAESVPDLFHIAFETGSSSAVGIPGSALHGHMASQLVRYALGEGAPIASLADWQEPLLVLFWAGLGASLGLWTRSTWQFAAVGAGAVVFLWLAGWGSLVAGWWIPVVPAAVACLGSASIVVAYLSNRERADRTELMQLFSRHVTKQVAEDVWQHREEFLAGGRPRPRRVTATILFLDMTGYTSRAEKMDPAELMTWLDSYLRVLSQRILDSGGLVDDYFGDGIMACFGIPIPPRDIAGVQRDAGNAVACAVDMEESVRQLNARWSEQSLPPIGIRIGICSGTIVAGSIGSADRLKYGVVGDVVVTAQRLESLGYAEHDFEAHPCRILISAQTRQHVADTFCVHEAGTFVLKGKAEPVIVYEVTGRAEP